MVEPRATPLQSLLDVLSPPRAFQALADALLALGDCLIRLISLLVTLFRLGDRAELSTASYAATATGRNLSKPAFRPTGKAPPSPIVPQADSPPWTTPETTPRFFTEPGFRSSSDDRSSTASLDDGRTSRLSTHSSSYASSRASSSSSSSSSSAASDNTPAGWFTFASSNRPVAPPPSPATASQNRRRARRMAFSIDESRFKLGRVLGSGAYGIVAECTDRETGRKLAIKKIRRIFNNSTDARRCLREVRILGHLEHDNLLHLKYAMLPRGPAGDVDIFSEIYIVSDFMDSDLEKVIKSSATKLEETHIRYIMWQILAGLKYLHSANIMHRDLKPANVLINAESEVKICDFGLARAESFSSTGDQSHATDYVVTRHYRAPEVIVDRTKYDKSVDVWAAACIMGELYNRKVVLPGRDQVHQLSLILALVGKPPEDVIDAINNRNAQRYVRMYKGKDGGVALGEVFPSASPDGLALMERMFLWNPAARVTAGDALGHLFFEEYADMLEWEEEEAPPLKMEFEGKDLSIARIRKLVHREVLRNSPGANTAPPSPSSSAVVFGNAPGSGVDADDVDHDDLKRKSKVDDGSGSDTTGTTGTANSGSPGSRGGAASPKDYDSGAGTSGVDAIEAEAWFSGRSGAVPISRSAPISIAAAVARALASTEDEPPPALVSSFDAEPFNPFTIRRLDGDLKTQKKKDDAGGDRAVGALAALLAADDASKAKAKSKEVDQGKHGLAALLAADDAAKAEASGKTKTAPPAATATTGGGPSPIAPLGRSTSSDSIGDAYATPGSLTPTD